MSYYDEVPFGSVRRFASQVQFSVEYRRRQREIEERRRKLARAQEAAAQKFHAIFEEQERMLSGQEEPPEMPSVSLRELKREVVQQERSRQKRCREMQSIQLGEMQRQTEQIEETAAQIRAECGQVGAAPSQLREEMERRLESLSQAQELDLAWTREQLRQSGERLAALEQQVADHRALADYWLSQGQRIAADIRSHLRPAHFEPERWRQVQRTLDNALLDFQAGMYQTAAGSGRDAYQSACVLRDDLTAAELEWQQTLEAVRSLEIAVMGGIADAEDRIYTFEMDGETLTEERGVDYWTYGQLTVLRGQIAQTQERLSGDTDALTTEQLRALEEEMRSHLTQLALLEQAAAANLLMAQRRFEMAERIGQVLGESFLMTEQDGDFFGEQNRDEYHAAFTNPTTGETAVVVITPLVGEDGIVVNHAELLVSTPTNSAEERQRISDTVVQHVAQDVPDFKLPCTGQYGARTTAEVQRTGNISAVSAGDEQVRSRCGVQGITYRGRQLCNPAASPANSSERQETAHADLF